MITASSNMQLQQLWVVLLLRADTAAIDSDTSLVVSPDTLQGTRGEAFVFYRDSLKKSYKAFAQT